MNLKTRLEKLGQAAPKGDHLSVAWRSVVTRSGDVLTEAVHSAHILGSDTAPGESLVRRLGEIEPVFVRHVLDRACYIWNRHDEAFREGIRWTPQPGSHLTRSIPNAADTRAQPPGPRQAGPR